MALSLDTFVRASTKTCFVCSIPERPELEEGREAGYSYAVMAKWLEEERRYQGPISEDRLRAHWRRGHHRKEQS